MVAFNRGTGARSNYNSGGFPADVNMRISVARPIPVLSSILCLTGFLSAFLPSGAALAGSEEIIYDNTDSIYQLGSYYPKILEYGDEVVLAGDARTITRFQFDYFGEFTPTGNETAIVRFYANDATPEAEGVYSSAPGTLLFESGAMLIVGGYNTLSLNNLHVRVPNHFTWTVQFGGLTGSYPRRRVCFSRRNRWWAIVSTISGSAMRPDGILITGIPWTRTSLPEFLPIPKHP